MGIMPNSFNIFIILAIMLGEESHLCGKSLRDDVHVERLALRTQS